MSRVQIGSLLIVLIIILSLTTSNSNAFPSPDDTKSSPSSGSKLQWRNGGTSNVHEPQDTLSFVSEELGIDHGLSEVQIQQPNANIQSENSQTLHRVKRNRPKIRYNRNKDVIRDY